MKLSMFYVAISELFAKIASSFKLFKSFKFFVILGLTYLEVVLEQKLREQTKRQK